MSKESVPPPPAPPHARRRLSKFLLLFPVLFPLALALQLLISANLPSPPPQRLPLHAEQIIARCRAHDLSPGPDADFYDRRQSDRYVPGSPSVLIRNARIWTGSENGTEVVSGDIFLDKGIIRGVGHLGRFHSVLRDATAAGRLTVVDAKGAWVTPGIIDSHSHLGVDSAPALNGADDTNSRKATVQPWLRSLDGLNTHDDAYPLSIAGGVTTALVLPGSANAIGGQAFTIKLRKTAERSPTSMLLEPPYTLNGTDAGKGLRPRWRQMKHACGENPSRVYKATRMDTFWAFREAYNKAKQIKEQQDAYCTKALDGQWAQLGDYPEDLQWEALVDVLRGHVRVQTHCYEAVDLDDLVRLTNEFKFSVAAVHHASEAYLVPDVLKRAYGHPPAAAIFATNGRYKREAYRSSEFAARILTDNGINVVMKSDHPVLNSRFLLYEAQQAHYYGLRDNLALAAVTSTAAHVVGMAHRIGYIKEGYDADLVIWDSHPLALGATPTQVFIDGLAQLESPFVSHKPSAFQSVPETPDFNDEIALTLTHDGLPPLAPSKPIVGEVLFVNVKSVFLPQVGQMAPAEVFAAHGDEPGVVLIRNGSLMCYGAQSACLSREHERIHTVIDLHGGAISPGLLSYGSPLGLQEIAQEPSTGDGVVLDVLADDKVPEALGSELVRAVDGLQFAGRSALIAYRAGVTKAISAPSHRRFISGLGTAFSTGAGHKLEKGAVIQEITALHVSISHFGQPSISTQIAALRKLLLAEDDYTELGQAFQAVVEGRIPLVIEAESADVIATLVLLKKEVESAIGSALRVTIAGATEAHLLAKEIAQAGIGIVLVPSRPFPAAWESKRILPGPPLSRDSAISALLAANVSVGIGVEEAWSARNARFDVGWAALEADGRISKGEAIALASTNLEKLLGGEVDAEDADLVATQGGDLLEFESKVVAVISPTRRVVDLF